MTQEQYLESEYNYMLEYKLRRYEKRHCEENVEEWRDPDDDPEATPEEIERAFEEYRKNNPDKV